MKILADEIPARPKGHDDVCSVTQCAFPTCKYYRVYQKKVNNYKMAYKSNMQLNFRRIFCEYGYFKVF